MAIGGKTIIESNDSIVSFIANSNKVANITRYQHFIETYSDIEKRVPQKMIASYFGVTPETLSAAKKEWYLNSD